MKTQTIKLIKGVMIDGKQASPEDKNNGIYYAATATLKQAEAAVVAKTATVGQLVATGNLTQAFKLATVQVRAFTASLLVNPFTYIAIAIAGVTYAVFNYKNALEETGKTLDDINAKYDQQTRAIDDNISTINRLVDVKKRSVTQEEELNKALDDLIAKYPSILGEYDKEILKLQGINSELAKRIYLMSVAEKKEQLLKEKEKTDKKVEDQHRAYIMNNQISAARFGTPIDTDLNNRKGVNKQVQTDQDRINKQLKDLEDLEKKILNNELSFGTTEEKKEDRKTSSAATVSDSDKRKAERAAEKARKEAIALRQAQLDAQILQARKNSEEEYALELQKIDAKIALEKKGTAAYQQALNERTRLEQQHQQQLGELEVERLKNKTDIYNLELAEEKKQLDKQKENKTISNEEYYNKLLEITDREYNLKVDLLNKEQELYKNDLKKYEEYEQERLKIKTEYDIKRQEIENESSEAEVQNWQEAIESMKSSFGDALEGFISGNQTLKESFISIFDDIKKAFAKMIVSMLAEKSKLAVINMSQSGGWLGTAGTAIRSLLHFSDGGIIPGQYNQPMPIVAHGSEMVLNPLQQKSLWNMIASGQGTGVSAQNSGANDRQQPVIINNINPIFQSLDPSQGQKLFQDWMKQSGIPIVKDSIKNNNHQMRDLIKGV